MALPIPAPAVQRQNALTGAGIALTYMATLALIGYALWPVDPPYGTTALDRLVLALGWQSVALLPLAMAMLLVAWQRYTLGALIALQPNPPALDVPVWYVRTTARHSFVLLIAHVSFALTTPPHLLPLITIAVLAYVTGRAALWASGPASVRTAAFAFTTSLVPSAAMLFYAAWWVLRVHAAMIGAAPRI